MIRQYLIEMYRSAAPGNIPMMATIVSNNIVVASCVKGGSTELFPIFTAWPPRSTRGADISEIKNNSLIFKLDNSFDFNCLIFFPCLKTFNYPQHTPRRCFSKVKQHTFYRLHVTMVTMRQKSCISVHNFFEKLLDYNVFNSNFGGYLKLLLPGNLR